MMPVTICICVISDRLIDPGVMLLHERLEFLASLFPALAETLESVVVVKPGFVRGAHALEFSCTIRLFFIRVVFRVGLQFYGVPSKKVNTIFKHLKSVRFSGLFLI